MGDSYHGFDASSWWINGTLFGRIGTKSDTLMSYDYNEYIISRIWMRQLFASVGQIVIFSIDIF